MSSKPGSGGPKLRRLNMGQVFIILAVVSAVLTMVVFKSIMSGPAPQKAEKVKTKPLVVAAQQLYSGEVLQANSLKVIEWPADHYPEGENVFDSPQKLIGRALKRDIYPGEPLFKMSLANESSNGGMPVVIPPGHRAMTILVREDKGVGGFIKPGDHVDVLGTFNLKLSQTSEKAVAENTGVLLEDSIDVSQTVLQDVLVLAIAQEMYDKKNVIEEGLEGSNSGNPPAETNGNGTTPANNNNAPKGDVTKGKVVSSITLAVTPEEAEKLAFADTRGQLRLALRPENEHEEVSLLGAFSQDMLPFNKMMEKLAQMTAGMDPSLFGPKPSAASSESMPPAPMAAASAPPPVFTSGKEIQLIEGTSKSSISF